MAQVKQGTKTRFTMKQRWSRLSMLLLFASIWLAAGHDAAAAVVELPVAHIGEVDREAIDAEGAAHRQGWRAVNYEYKMDIAAELVDEEPFVQVTVFPYIQSLAWYEARFVQYMDGKDDEFAQEYFEQASLYPEALLFQVAIAGDEDVLQEENLFFLYEDSTGSKNEAKIYMYEYERPGFFQRYATAIVWVVADLPANIDDIDWFSLRIVARDVEDPSDSEGTQAKWMLARES